MQSRPADAIPAGGRRIEAFENGDVFGSVGRTTLEIGIVHSGFRLGFRNGFSFPWALGLFGHGRPDAAEREFEGLARQARDERPHNPAKTERHVARERD